MLLALILRIVLLSEWPHAFYWTDSKDIFYTTKRWFEDYTWTLHYKKTWWSPFFYTVGAYLPGGILNWAAWAQHLLGIVCVFLTGGICRLWFAHWRWLIIPVTLLVAVNPSMIVWEHSIMQEPWFLTALLGLTFATAVFVTNPNGKTFAWMAFCIFLCASARPEGKLFLATGFLAIVIVWWKKWRTLGVAALAMVSLTLVLRAISPEGQAGLLLLTSVVKFAPDTMPKFPGLAERLQPERDALRHAPTVQQGFPNTITRRNVSAIVKEWLIAKGVKKAESEAINKTSLKVAKQICLQNVTLLPGWIWQKFRRVSDEQPHFIWTSEYLIDDQIQGLSSEPKTLKIIGKGLFGTEAPTDVKTWVAENVKTPSETDWMRRWEHWLDANVYVWRTPEFAEAPEGSPLPGVPLFKVIAAVGLLARLIGTGVHSRIQWTFAPVLAGVLIVILLTANIKPRFLFLFEPFWVLYLALLVDSTLRFFSFLSHKFSHK